MARPATKEELDELWTWGEEFWKRAFKDADGPPWVKAPFLIDIFKVSLRQRGLTVPPHFRVASEEVTVDAGGAL